MEELEKWLEDRGLMYSYQVSTREMDAKLQKLKSLKPGDFIDIGSERVKVTGFEDGNILVDSPKHGKCYVRPENVS